MHERPAKRVKTENRLFDEEASSLGNPVDTGLSSVKIEPGTDAQTLSSDEKATKFSTVTGPNGLNLKVVFDVEYRPPS